MSQAESDIGPRQLISIVEETSAAAARTKAIREQLQPFMQSLLDYYTPDPEAEERSSFAVIGKGEKRVLIYRTPYFEMSEDGYQTVNYFLMCDNGLFALRFIDHDRNLTEKNLAFLALEEYPTQWEVPGKTGSIVRCLYEFHDRLKSDTGSSSFGFKLQHAKRIEGKTKKTSGLCIDFNSENHTFMASTEGSSWKSIAMNRLTSQGDLGIVHAILKTIQNKTEETLQLTENQFYFVQEIVPTSLPVKLKRHF